VNELQFVGMSPWYPASEIIEVMGPGGLRDLHNDFDVVFWRYTAQSKDIVFGFTSERERLKLRFEGVADLRVEFDAMAFPEDARVWHGVAYWTSDSAPMIRLESCNATFHFAAHRVCYSEVTDP
jgi:hypothetical protein